MDQIIIHVDMDAFFASVETRDNPALRGKPLIIGALPGERGVVATCSYEARKYGIHSAMNIKEAYRLCPNGIYINNSLKLPAGFLPDLTHAEFMEDNIVDGLNVWLIRDDHIDSPVNQDLLVKILRHGVFGPQQSHPVNMALFNFIRCGVRNMYDGDTHHGGDLRDYFMHRIGADQEEIRTGSF